eukprot:1156717-Pelagomonas_calceolata.AAC.10
MMRSHSLRMRQAKRELQTVMHMVMHKTIDHCTRRQEERDEVSFTAHVAGQTRKYAQSCTWSRTR